MSSAAAPSSPPGFAALLRFLQSPAAHQAHAGAGLLVETVETHMSWVFLVGDQVLKLKKPVRYPFLDFSTLAAREACCREELRLNARLASGVYLGLMALRWHDGRLVLQPESAPAGPGQTVDWLVWMRRLPAERMLDRAIADGTVVPAMIDALLDRLGAFYRGATPVALEPAEYVARLEREQAVNRELLLRPQFQLRGAAAALDRLDQALRRGRGALHERAARGCIVDGHGDLRPEHVCLLQPPVVIDCLEFNPQLRQVDPFDELVFLALECELAGAPWVAERLLAGGAGALGAAPPPALLQLYGACRALLRARLAIAHLLDPQPRLPHKWPALAQRYVDRALAGLGALAADAGVSAATRRGTP